MPKAIVFHATGGPGVLRWEDVHVEPPAANEVQIRHTAIGLNFIDVYDRSGLYPQTLPAVPGREAAGIIVAMGRKVREFAVGQRVAYIHNVPGTYTQLRNVPVNRVVKLPRYIADDQAAAVMLKGLTAQMLVRRVHRLCAGESILVHAAAGGVGSLLCQWARSLGARVIGIVGHEDKRALARRQGCHRVLLAGRDDTIRSVRAYTRGQMLDAVYDSVGKDTFMESLGCLRSRGMLISYGNASGPPPSISPLELARHGSLFLTRPVLFDYVAQRAALDAAARELFRLLRAGTLKVRIGQRYALADAARAHEDLEARRTVGSTVLIP